MNRNAERNATNPPPAPLRTPAELDASNFLRKVLAVDGRLIESGRPPEPTGGRPARLYVAGLTTRISPPWERPGDGILLG